MAYNESICWAGRTREHRLYYSIRQNRGREHRREARARKSKPTSERQAAINRRNARETLTRVLNANFGSGDLYVTYTYAKENRPKSLEQFQAQVQNLLERLRRLYKKLGLTFKYIWVAERGERGAAHIHMVMSGIDVRLLQEKWPYGYVTVKPMDPSGNYHKLAAYLIKYSDKTLRTENKLQGKRYNPSKNLTHPIPEKTRIRKRRSFDPGAIRVPEGWYLDEDTVSFGISDLTGFEYLSYTLVLLPGYEVVKKKAVQRRRP